MIKETKKEKSKVRRIAEWIFLTLTVMFLATRVFPETLIWPYSANIGDTQIYSEQPISPNKSSVLAKSDQLIRKSAIYSQGYGKRIFLTQGRWRWKLLSLTLSGSFAHSSQLSGAIVVNRNSVADDWVRNGKSIGGQRKLSSLIAHERTHGLIFARYGYFERLRFPRWKIEGYCDYVAQESSLSAADVDSLKRSGKKHPAIVYFEGHERVAAILAKNGGSVDHLFGK